MPVVIDTQAPGELSEARWGLIPFWSKDDKGSYSTINARAETVEKMPAFRDAWKKRRCLIPCDGFYEWRGPKGAKQPFHIRMRDGAPFAFAGLWEEWRDPQTPEAEPLKSCAIITAEPNELVAQIHNRMAVILPRDRWKAWLAKDTTSDARKAMLTPYPAAEMTAALVSTRVNRAGQGDEDPTLEEPKRRATVHRADGESGGGDGGVAEDDGAMP